MPPGNEEFRKKLRDHISDNPRTKITKTELAETRLGINRQTFYKYLNGGSRMPEATLAKLIEILKLSGEEARELRALGGYPPVGPRANMEPYLRWIEETLGYTRPLGIGTELVQLSLEKVHVPLRAVDRNAIEAHRRRMRGGNPGASAEPEAGERPLFAPLSETDPKPILILGDAGSGKSTTLCYAALCFADAYRRGDVSRLADELGVHLHEPLLPIYVRLALFAETIPDRSRLPPEDRERFQDATEVFFSWLDQEAARQCDLPEDVKLSSLVRQNDARVLLLLDGLDEVSREQRIFLATLITTLARRYPRQRYVVASRIAGYRGEVSLPNFSEQYLSPLDPEAARKLLEKWFTAAYERQGIAKRLIRESASEQVEQLWRNISRSERLSDLATNPLLLTAIALLKFNHTRLPDQRAKLYENLITLLLELWQAKRNYGIPNASVPSTSELNSARRRLEALALEMQQQPGQVREVALERAQEWLAPVYERFSGVDREAANERVRDLLRYLSMDSGIIREHERVYSFFHYTFQEYLAARALDSLDHRPGTEGSVAFLLARSREARWRETLLLAAGSWCNGQLWYKAGQLLEGLLGQQDVEALLLAADLLVDVGVVDELTPMRNETTKRLRGLAALSDDWRTSAHPDPVVRNRAATLLGRLDADVDRLCRDPGQADYWAARIEPGTFSMGQDRDETITEGKGEQGAGAYDDEAPQFAYHIRHPYAIGRFPVTNQQYLSFLEALDARNTPAAQQLWELMQEIPYPRSWPERWRYRSGEGNHPVAGVTWYAATAFAWWAHETFLTPEQRAAGESIRLPTEAEWERAAAYPLVLPGGDPRVGRREYPWGGSVAASKSDRVESSIQANIDISGIEGTSVVGIFPHGVADCGAEELAGNVWEWCSTPKLDYPFRDEVRAESLYSGEQRVSIPYVLRGGSWYDKRDFARGASRHEDKVYDSHRGYDATGLRLARLFPLP